MRGFLADKEIDHEFVDVRKKPRSPAETLKLVRAHKEAVATRGGKLFRVKIADASDEELLKLFLGREGTLRAPTVSDGKTILGGFDAETLKAMVK